MGGLFLHLQYQTTYCPASPAFAHSHLSLSSIFFEQDISKLRRDVKVAFEDMTSQMNRSVALQQSCHLSSLVSDSREQFFSRYIAPDCPVISSQGNPNTEWNTVFSTIEARRTKRESFTCTSSLRSAILHRSCIFVYFRLSTCRIDQPISRNICQPVTAPPRCIRHRPHPPPFPRLYGCHSISVR